MPCDGKDCDEKTIPTCENEGTTCVCLNDLKFNDAGTDCVGKYGRTGSTFIRSLPLP